MSKIEIRPYSTSRPNMGLEKYKQVLFEGTKHKYTLWAKEDVPGSGRFRPINGMDEFAPELDVLSPEVKKARVKQIREKAAKIEAILAGNDVDVKDKDFWSKIKVVHPQNTEFWNKVVLEVSNEPRYIDPTSASDLILVSAIEAGGFPDVAPSLEEAKKSNKGYKFYLDKHEDTAKANATLGIVEDEAKALLLDLYKNDKNKLFYVCKVLDQDSIQYKKTTSADTMYGKMRSYIEGETSNRYRKNSASHFTEVASQDLQSLKLRALVKDASYSGQLVFRNNEIFEVGTNVSLGNDPTEAVEFLKNPLNDAILGKLLSEIEVQWNS